MAYDNSSLTGDEICDYHYDIENNFMNPPSPTGFFIYKIIGGCFDWLGDLITQFRTDYSILDCSVGSVEIVNGFPEEPDTNHTYYVHQYNTSTDACFTKYSFVDGEWVSETVTGDVLNSLDVFWGRSYNLPRPLLYEGQKAEYLFIDNGTTASHNDEDWVKYNPQNITITRGEEYTSLTGSNYRYGVPIPNNCTIKVETRKTTQSTGTLLSIWTYSSNPASASQLLTFSVTEMGMTQGTFANLEMTVTPTTVTVKNLDNDTTITKEYSTSNNLIFNFWGTTFDYKNFRVYTGEEKERPLNDEEYRIYLYLKNHQLLTMKDLLVAFGNAFGSAETSTTILNSIHTVDHKKYDDPSFSNDTLAALDSDDTDIITDKLVDKSGVDVINDRFAQGTLSIQIPDEGWDEEFLSLLESFISIKGNILISQGG